MVPRKRYVSSFKKGRGVFLSRKKGETMDHTTWGLIVIAAGALVSYGSGTMLKAVKKQGNRTAEIIIRAVGLAVVIVGTLMVFGFIGA